MHECFNRFLLWSSHFSLPDVAACTRQAFPDHANWPLKTNDLFVLELNQVACPEAWSVDLPLFCRSVVK